jgi:mannose-6-phosphate isomerase-like protein (cupin superfamily)
MHELIADAEKAGKRIEFRVPDLSMDCTGCRRERPIRSSLHGGRVYYVISGRGGCACADDRLVMGDLVYVAKAVEHKFHSIEEDLTLLVFFAPAEYSMAPTSD